ncbi:PBSX family phage terminase large subunit [Burkholderia glumae]|uniref:PBSX family phage terminase large subunit n=1 Tax=Burkholderia glumae TaxID=337 RepID=UPI0001A4B4E7|nr:PBSX family phage terminase large subunit [Burkholderia glumae]ACR29209.1 phage terminase large subunit [Burkholderia glumae BGR1]
MSRRRISRGAIDRVERYFKGIATKAEPAVFGICNMQREVIKRVDVAGRETDAEPTVLIPQKLERLIYPKRLKIVWGGRGSAKTRTIVSILTAQASTQRERILCLREVQNSIEESSHAELAEEIERRDLGGSFVVGRKVIRVPATRSSFSFRGLYRNVTGVKGFAKATKAWVDEAENVSRESWDVLLPTIREPGSEIIVSFNPNRENDPTWADLVGPYVDRLDEDGCYEDADTLIIRANYTDNPWFTEELELERAKMERTDLDRYRWIWLGKFNRRSDELIFAGKWRVEDIEAPPNTRFFFGADWGFAVDPTTLNRCWVRGNDLIIDYEAHGKQVDLDEIWKLFAGREGMRPEQIKQWKPVDEFKYPGIPGARKWKIKADCARPETISHVAKQGFNIDAAKKWGGSVEDGIAFLRGFDAIIIHSRCVKTKEEFENYSYKVDKATGDVLPIIVDKWNHHIDGIRYSMDGYIRGRGTGLNISPDALRALMTA